jgi:UPF0755 protein
MKRGHLIALVAALLLIAAPPVWFMAGWFMPSVREEERPFIVPAGASLTSVAAQLEKEGFIASADRFLWGAKLFGGNRPIKAGEFLLPVSGGGNQILSILQSDEVIRRLIAIPEGVPSIMVHERLMAEELLSGDIPVPREGSVLPDSYDYQRGETRAAVLGRMQAAMTKELAELWAKRTPTTVIKSPAEAVILASIVEKETGVASERRMVAGLYSNRVRSGMMLQADPTIIYPITKGKPLGRRIRQSEIGAVNGYNTYAMVGLPEGPITNPGRDSIAAVLNPEKTSALYMVANGQGGHVFSDTLEQHNANVAKWFAIRRQRGEIQ